MGAEQKVAEVATALVLSLTPPKAPLIQETIIPNHHVLVMSEAKSTIPHITAPNGETYLVQVPEPVTDELDSLLDPKFRPSLTIIGPVDAGFMGRGILARGISEDGWIVEVVNYFTPEGRNYYRGVSVDLTSGPGDDGIRTETLGLLNGNAEIDDLLKILAHFSPLGRDVDQSRISSTGYTFYEGMPERGQSLDFLSVSHNRLPDDRWFDISVEERWANFGLNLPNLPVSDEQKNSVDIEPWSTSRAPELLDAQDSHIQSVQGILDQLIKDEIGRAQFSSISRGTHSSVLHTATSISGRIGNYLNISVNSFDKNEEQWPGRYWETAITPFIYPGARLTSALERLVYKEGTVEDMVEWANEIVNMPGESLGRKWILFNEGSERNMVMTELDLGNDQRALVQVYYRTFQDFPGNFPGIGFPWLDIQFFQPQTEDTDESGVMLNISQIPDHAIRQELDSAGLHEILNPDVRIDWSAPSYLRDQEDYPLISGQASRMHGRTKVGDWPIEVENIYELKPDEPSQTNIRIKLFSEENSTPIEDQIGRLFHQEASEEDFKDIVSYFFPSLDHPEQEWGIGAFPSSGEGSRGTIAGTIIELDDGRLLIADLLDSGLLNAIILNIPQITNTEPLTAP